MKQETKKLVDWIKKQINIAKTNNIDPAWNGNYEAYNVDYNRAMAFLDSLLEIESHLTKGGYIQDKNGIPCCEGDKVKFYGDRESTGSLWWYREEGMFLIRDRRADWKLSEISYFEKLE